MKKCKIQITENSKKLITMFDADNVKEMVDSLKAEELETAIYDYLDIAMSPIKYSNWTFYDVSMEVCKNCRVYNYYTENSADFDIWVKFKAFNEYDGFYVVGICLSDIYSISDSNKDEVKQHMYIRAYTENK